MAPKKAPTLNASVFAWVERTPMDSAAISSSRTAMQSRPCRESRKLLISTIVPAVSTNSQFQLTNCGMPERPAAPLLNSKLSSSTRMISAMPNVAMAR